MATLLTPPALPVLVLLVLPSWGAAAGTPPGDAEPLEALGALLSSGTGSLPRGAVESLVGTAAARAHCGAGPCGKCISAADVFGLLGKAGADARLDAAELPWLGAAVVLTLLDPAAACAAAAAGTWATRARALHDAFANGTEGSGGPGLQEVAALLEAVQRHYRSAGTRQPCLDAAAVVAESAAAVPGAGAGARVLAALGTQLLRGRCLRAAPALPGPDFFLDFILARFGNGSQSLPLEGLTALMEELGLGHHDHDHDHDHDHGARAAHPEHRSSRRARSPTAPRSAANESQQWDAVCFSAQQLLQAHGIGDTAEVSRQELQELSPALLQQVLSGACSSEEGETPSGGLSVAEKYLYGSLATLVICLGSLVGAAVLLCSRCPRVHHYVLQLLLALAVGTLTGDALLHLLPQFLQLHSHAAGVHAHAVGAEATWQLLAVLGGLYGFFLLESLLGLLAPGGHEEGLRSDPAGGLQLCDEETRRRKQLEGTSCSELVEEPPLSQSEQELQRRELRALPCMVTLGDALHNLADGLALGAAFGSSWRTGLGTALAVLCHELPHELGDFAALLHAGLSVRRALALNVASALPAFLGLYLALGLATGAAFQGWIFTVATGFFLYVALCDMLPAMLRVRDPRPWVLFALHNAGLLGGWGLLLLLALYEESIAL